MTTRTQEAPAVRARRSWTLLGAAAALVVGVVAAVLVLGVARPPQLPTLAAAPEPVPPGGVAWTTWREGDSCLQVAQPDGSVDELWCEPDGTSVVAWTADGIVLQVWRSGEQLVTIDPRTGDVLDRQHAGPWSQALGEGVISEHKDGRLVVSLERSREVVWEVPAPDTYRVTTGVVAPDGGWVAMVDAAHRLLVVPTAGGQPRIWADDMPPWRDVVWEGTPLE